MEFFAVIVIISLAALYVGYTFYKQFSGKGGCSSGCSCGDEMKKNCTLPYQSLDKFKLK